MELAKYLKKETILLSPQSQTKKELLNELIQILCVNEGEVKSEKVLRRVLEREEKRSTGFGKGLAVAHARIEPCPELKVIVARPKVPLDWAASDGLPVTFVMLVIGSDSQESLYLQILAEITKIWARKKSRALLLSAQVPEEVLQVIQEAKTRTRPRE